MSQQQVIKVILRATRKQYGAKEKIRTVLEGLCGEVTAERSRTKIAVSKNEGVWVAAGCRLAARRLIGS